MTSTIRALSLLLAATPLAGSALAQSDTFSNTMKLGIAQYTTHSKSSGIRGIGIPAGADSTTSDATTVLFTYERAIAPKVGLELDLGLPPKITAKASGSVAFLGEVLSAKNVSPTVFVNYHFGEPGARLRPYAALGVNFTRFVDLRNPFGWKVSLSDSWGLAIKGGLDYALNRQWGVFASVTTLQVKSDLVASGASVLQTTIDFRPVVYSTGLRYQF